LASSDSGSSWSLLDDFAPPGRYILPWDVGGGIASDADGNLYVTGVTYDNDYIQPDQWYVRRSTDAGATWTTVDDFLPGGTPGYSGDITGIAVDSAGDVYVSGQAADIWSNQGWTIRKGALRGWHHDFFCGNSLDRSQEPWWHRNLGDLRRLSICCRRMELAQRHGGRRFRQPVRWRWGFRPGCRPLAHQEILRFRRTELPNVEPIRNVATALKWCENSRCLE